MADPARRLATVDDLMARVDAGEVYLELWNGELVPQAMPRLSHSRAATKIAVSISGFDDDEGGEGPGGWWIGVEVHWRIDATTAVVMDVGGWLRERLPEAPDGAVPIRPDWACANLTPGDAARDLVDKAVLYAREGVPWYWIVDAEEGVVECRRNVDGMWQVHGTWKRGQVARIPPFDAVELVLDRLFMPRRKAT
jgi:Uma2 family endonuclease